MLGEEEALRIVNLLGDIPAEDSSPRFSEIAERFLRISQPRRYPNGRSRE
jgi:hypothetical protein